MAVTWQGSRRALFLDGKCVKATTTTLDDSRFVPGAEEITIGGALKVDRKPRFETLIDELRISDCVRYRVR